MVELDLYFTAKGKNVGRVKVAESWEEVLPERFSFLADQLSKSKNMADPHFMQACYYASDIRADLFARLQPDEVFIYFAPAVAKLLETPYTEIYFLRNIGITVGPTNQLENRTMEQWSFADLCLKAYLKTKEEKELNNLLACLYHFPLQQWSKENIELNGTKFATVKPTLKQAALFNFMLVNRWITQRFTYVFEPPDKAQPPNPFGMFGIFVSMAGPVLGSFKEVVNQNVPNGFTHLNHACYLAKKEREKIKAAKRK